jgi:hypothetical protein
MKSSVVLIAGAMLVSVALAESCDPVFAQGNGPPPQYQSGPPPQYQDGPPPPPQQYQGAMPGPGERFAEEMYRRGYRAGYMAARHNERYDDRVPDPREQQPDDRYGYRPDRQGNDGPPPPR